MHSNEATLLWDEPGDVHTGVTYEILRDGKVVGESTKTHFTVSGDKPEYRVSESQVISH